MKLLKRMRTYKKLQDCLKSGKGWKAGWLFMCALHGPLICYYKCLEVFKTTLWVMNRLTYLKTYESNTKQGWQDNRWDREMCMFQHLR